MKLQSYHEGKPKIECVERMYNSVIHKIMQIVRLSHQETRIVLMRSVTLAGLLCYVGSNGGFRVFIEQETLRFPSAVILSLLQVPQKCSDIDVMKPNWPLQPLIL